MQKDLDIAEYTDADHNPMIPHVIVLEPGLIVYKVYNGYWFFGWPTMEDLRQDMRAVTMQYRPGWGITTPAMRAAWKEGKKELFYPHGMTYAQTLGEQDQGWALERRRWREMRVSGFRCVGRGWGAVFQNGTALTSGRYFGNGAEGGTGLKVGRPK